MALAVYPVNVASAEVKVESGVSGFQLMEPVQRCSFGVVRSAPDGLVMSALRNVSRNVRFQVGARLEKNILPPLVRVPRVPAGRKRVFQ
jgi:hypothetical protein